jgi:hypothetical protein
MGMEEEGMVEVVNELLAMDVLSERRFGSITMWNDVNCANHHISGERLYGRLYRKGYNRLQSQQIGS